MKKIFLGFTCLAFVGLSTACHEFLEENPKTDITAGQYFSYPTHAHAAVNHLYRNGFIEAWDAGVYRGADAMLGNYLSGLYDNEYAGQEAFIQYSLTLTLNPQNMNSKTGEVWERGYKGVARANTAIKYIPDTPGLTESEINSLVAQAKFFRALNYFYLTKHFGAIPLILEPYESLEDLYVERTPVATIYSQIITDLTDAIQSGSLNNETFVKNGYRITLGTAQTLLAHVYMQMTGSPLNDESAFAKAAEMARTVIRDTPYSLTTHDDFGKGSAYNKLRTIDNLDEIIYAREADATHSSATSWTQIAFPGNKLLPVMQFSIANQAYRPSAVILGAYHADKDLRIQEKQFFFTEFEYTDANGITQVEPLGQTAPYHFYNEEATLVTGRSSKDRYVYRYAEVLLIAAEAIARTEGVTSEAIGYLADVRGRAYYGDREAALSELQSITGTSQFIEEVWKERVRELVYDFRLWDDVQRTGKYPVSASNGDITFRDVIGAQNPRGATFEAKHLLWPLPVSEMQRNPALGTDNNGY
ncbi:MAG: RagB/SusD family nutrient uptake outer membrane protein [Tannerellaceae bacterium]|nr:RagB/SusD family nutrient uptake outer membrane protein [Tannerellaceae bacterium]